MGDYIMRRIIILYAVTTILLSACNSQPAITANAVIADTPIPPSSSTPKPTQTLTPAPTYTPTITLTPAGGGSGKIVFVSDKDGDSEIYVMNSDGSQQTRLTDNSYLDDSPQWSPDGKKIVFISDRVKSQSIFARDIFIMDADGSNQIRITNNFSNESPMTPQWSPDGKKILFYDTIGYDINLDRPISEIYVINIDGTDLTRLTHNNLGVIDPKWSPDGTKIVYSLHDYGVGNIYVINADGTGETRLTFNHRYNINPEWSPDGGTIAYMSSISDGFYDIYTIKPDGTDETRITKDAYSNGLSDWSPDGSKLTYTYNDDETNESICFVDINSKIVNCLKNLDWDENPKWSPDGKKIAFISNLDGVRNIYLMNTDGSEIIRLTNNNNNGNSLWQFQWSP